eukprot:m.27574 g.27574  ORF g.27574 m.27574 type:complete len:516 (+) comp8574_c0_seq2:47-1594(+)
MKVRDGERERRERRKSEEMAAPMVAMLLCALTVAAQAQANTQISVTLTVGKQIAETFPQYVSFDMDWWYGNSGSGGGWGNLNAIGLDLDNPTLKSAAKALSPGFLRIGGSLDNIVKYLVGDMTAAECHEPTKFRGTWTLCLNMSRFADIVNFVDDAGLDLVFGVSFFHNKEGRWNATNVIQFLEHMANEQHFAPAALELGEEMAPSPPSSTFDNLVDGYRQLKANATRIFSAAGLSPPKILGPCVGMSDETPGHMEFVNGFVNATLGVPSPFVDGIVMHSYNNDGGDGWKHPGFLQQTLLQARAMLAAVRSVSATTPLWCGECGPHNGGGVKNVTDRFISSLWYNDALGTLAAIGFKQFGRQAVVGAHYALLDASLQPNPDLYVAVLWKQFMGPVVLNASLSGLPDTVHAFAHCAPAGNGSVSVVLVNIGSTEVSVAFAAPRQARHDLVFTAPDLLSTTVLLNGAPLRVSPDGSLPALAPHAHVTPDSAATPLALPATAYALAYFPTYGAQQCKH